MSARFFEQSEYDVRELRMEQLSGYAYRFSLLLPVTEKGKEIFLFVEEQQLRELLGNDFGGYTCTQGVTHPLVMGEYLDEETGVRIPNEHTRFEVYARQDEYATQYFTELAGNLEEYSKRVIAKRLDDYEGEQKILIEIATVRLL